MRYLRCRRFTPGFTLIELLVVVAIIALLVAILVPAVNEARAVALRAVCGTRLHSLTIIMLEYAHDYNGKFPRPRGNVHGTNLGREAGLALYNVYGLRPENSTCPSVDLEWYMTVRVSERTPWGLDPVPAMDRFSVGYFFLTSMQKGGHAWSIPATFDEAPATIYEDPDKIIVCDITLRADWDWLSWDSNDTSHKDSSAGRPDGANTAFLDGSVSWFDAAEWGPAADGIDTQIGNYDKAWWDYGSESYFWGVRGQYRKPPGWQPSPAW